jgi:hypothetical protein
VHIEGLLNLLQSGPPAEMLILLLPEWLRQQVILTCGGAENHLRVSLNWVSCSALFTQNEHLILFE